MLDITLFLLVIVSLGIGYFLGNRERSRTPKVHSQRGLSSAYVIGLNYLLNEQTDEAIESFVRALTINSETIETFMVLGRLFRQRGELERAIQTHQDLLARPSLTREQMLDVQLELARDYKQAGVFDRAEALLQDIVSQRWPSWRTSVQTLLAIYEKEQEWGKAVQLISSLKGGEVSGLEHQHSHYLCELAERALRQSDNLSARNHLRLATKVCYGNVRVSLLRGQTELKAGNPRAAVKALEKILDQDRSFIPESIPLLEQSYSRLRSRRGLTAYLERCLQDAPSAAVIMAIARLIAEQRGESDAGCFVADQMISCPSLKGLSALIDIHLQTAEGRARDNLIGLRTLTDRLERSQPIYRCSQCGFDGKVLHWQCPRCRGWGSTRPIWGLKDA